MSSADSDDEPLSVIASKKQVDEDYVCDSEFNDSDTSFSPVERKKKKKKRKRSRGDVPLKLGPEQLRLYLNPVQVTRPVDVWMYLKDLSITGPYSCLLCPEWFINKSKMVIHYILNHKKDYCGICRYFVTDSEKWEIHQSFHLPKTCSQCPLQFESDKGLAEHFSSVHNSVHCRLCCFMISDGEEYNRHLFKKHNVVNVNNKNMEFPWQIEYEGSTKFLCVLCTKNPLVSDFFRHFMCYHKFTLKCFTQILSGNEIPFSIEGAEISQDFLDSHLQEQFKYGYVGMDKKGEIDSKTLYLEDNTHTLLKALIPEIKQEIMSDDEGADPEQENEDINLLSEQQESSKESQEPLQEQDQILEHEQDEKHEQEQEQQQEQEQVTEEEQITEKDKIKKKRDAKKKNSYKGEVTFDVTLTEVVILQDVYYNYINTIKTQSDTKELHNLSKIDFTLLNYSQNMNMDCPVCEDKDINLTDFTNHLFKMHSVKYIPNYFCRLCAATFDSENEFRSHETEELTDFHNLWICQFCDDEFLNREETREHLVKHLENIEIDNCFSPHLGFKCRYCPTLFWTEADREIHHTDAHYNSYTKDFYKCSFCKEISSDKVWFTYHVLQKHKGEDLKSILYLMKCTLCALVFPNIDEVRNHFDEDHPEATKIFCCLPPCKWRPLSQQKTFKIHVKVVHETTNMLENGKQRQHSCGICGREFLTSKACNTHMSLSHGPSRFKCKFCPSSMHSADERKLHYLIKHPGQFHYECKICKKTFQYKSSLYIHRNNVHTKLKEPHPCGYCGKVFMKRESYREHMQIHEGPRHTCSYCPMTFVQRSNMLRHERRHTGERPYTCAHCPRTFADRGACSSHEKTHNRTTVNSCMYCGQTFVQKSKLTYHLRKHTGENLEACPVCSKLFTNTYALREHLKRHDGKSSMPCPICNKSFSDQSSIMKHIRRMHSSLAAQSCPLCNKVLSTIVGLRKHLFTHTDIKQFNCRKCGKAYSNRKSILKHLSKRHRIKSDTSFYIKQLDPRDCKIGVSEETITQIFGKRRKKCNDVLINNTITVKELPFLNIEDGKKNFGDTDGDASESDEEDKNSFESENNDITGPCEVEPTNFVSIKIEPVDDENIDDTE